MGTLSSGMSSGLSQDCIFLNYLEIGLKAVFSEGSLQAEALYHSFEGCKGRRT